MLREFARLARCFGAEDLRPLIGMVARAVRMVARSAQPVTDADGLSTRVIWRPTVDDRTKAVGMLHHLARRGPVGRDPADDAPIPCSSAGSSVQPATRFPGVGSANTLDSRRTRIAAWPDAA